MGFIETIRSLCVHLVISLSHSLSLSFRSPRLRPRPRYLSGDQD